MAAGDFSASNMNRALVRLGEMFASPNHTVVELNEPALSAQALLENNRARFERVYTGNHCSGVKAWFLRGAHNPITTTPDSCTTPAGVYSETSSQNYDNEMLAGDAQRVLSARCDNEVAFAEEMAFAMSLVMASNRKQLNEAIIARIAAQAQTNISALPDAWSTSGADILVPAADFKWDNLGEFQFVANNNLLGSPYFMLTGYNLYNELFLSQAYAQSPENQARMRAFGNSVIYQDARYLDTLVGSKSTFAIEQNSFAFWNFSWGSSTPQEISVGSTGKKMQFWVNDPVLRYRDGTTLRPVQHIFEVEESCSDRNTNTEIQIQYNIFGRIMGGFKFAPNGRDSDSNTTKGVVKFVRS